MYTKQPLPLSSPVYRNVDDTELVDDSAVLYDGILDERGGTRRRPGLSLLKDLGTVARIDGLFWWEDNDYAIGVSGGRTFKLEYSAGVLSSTELTGTTLASNERVSFATDGTYVYMANGGQINYTNGTANTAVIADGDAPTSVNSVQFLDNYILANEADTQKWYWSNLLDGLNWGASDFAQAIGAPDICTRMHVMDREVFLFGPTSLEVWENDGVTPFSRIPGGFFKHGCIAKQSVIETTKGLMWINDKRQVVEYSNRGIDVIPTPYDRELQEEFSDVSDCVTDRVQIAGQDLIIFHFPTARRTLVYNYSMGLRGQIQSWQEWGFWDTNAIQYYRWKGNAVLYCPAWGLTLVGDRETGYIYTFSSDNYDDNGDEIRIKRETGHLDRGTNNRKRCRRIMIRVKRGAVDISRDAKLMVRYQDDGSTWSNIREINLGDIGEREMTVQLWRLGVYRQRKWEITATDGVPIIWSRAEEEFEVLNK